MWPNRASVFASLAALGCAVASPGSSSEATGSSDAGETDAGEPTAVPDPMVVMTFNVLCSFCDDTYDPWEDRVGYISDTIARHSPDLVGLQELFDAEEVQQLLDLNPGYDALFYSDDTTDYADSTLWWRTDRYDLVDSGFYWLSPTPNVPLSNGFAAPQLPRLVAWAILHEAATGAEFFFAGTHFDNNSPSQELSAPLLLRRTESQADGLPIVVVGDFNATPDSAAYSILVDAEDEGGFSLLNTFDLADDWSVESNETPPATYDETARIDHLFVAGGDWSVPWWVVDTWVYGTSGLPTSDHYAMAAELRFEG